MSSLLIWAEAIFRGSFFYLKTYGIGLGLLFLFSPRFPGSADQLTWSSRLEGEAEDVGERDTAHTQQEQDQHHCP